VADLTAQMAQEAERKAAPCPSGATLAPPQGRRLLGESAILALSLCIDEKAALESD
jgi:hypothetical protein